MSGVAVVIASVASTISELVVEAVFPTESVAVMVTLDAPPAVGVPLITPPVERVSPAGSEEPLAASPAIRVARARAARRGKRRRSATPDDDAWGTGRLGHGLHVWLGVAASGSSLPAGLNLARRRD